MNLVHRIRGIAYAATRPVPSGRLGSHTRDAWAFVGGAALCYMAFFDSLGEGSDADKMVAAFEARTGEKPQLVILTDQGGRALGPVAKKHANVILFLVASTNPKPMFNVVPIVDIPT